MTLTDEQVAGLVEWMDKEGVGWCPSEDYWGGHSVVRAVIQALQSDDSPVMLVSRDAELVYVPGGRERVEWLTRNLGLAQAFGAVAGVNVRDLAEGSMKGYLLPLPEQDAG